MNAREKKRFIRELLETLSKSMREKVPDMPEEWDGIEIRQLLADTFAANTYPRLLTGKRKRDYRNEIHNRNL